jgi:hypothetical protein
MQAEGEREGHNTMWLVLLLAAAVGLCWYLWRQRNERIAADEVRSILNSRIEEFKKVGSLRAFQDRFFTGSVKDEIESGIFPPEDIEKNRMRALKAEREGRGLFLAVATFEAVLKHSRTKAQMISLMEHYVLDFGRRNFETRPRIWHEPRQLQMPYGQGKV